MVTTLKKIHAFEQLGEIEAEKDVDKKTALLKEYGAKAPLNFILSLNFNKTVLLDLPEGMPPLDLKDMDAHTHPDFMGLLGSNIAKLKYCLKSNKDLSQRKKETIFYEVLINCPLKDAEILCSAKDKALGELYPSITAELVKGVFPAFVKDA